MDNSQPDGGSLRLLIDPPEDWQPTYYPVERVSRKRLAKPDVRADVWDKTDGKCWYCGKQTNPWRDFCIDHFLALTRGGADDLANLVPCCRSCNNRKGNRSIPHFRHIMAGTQGPSFTPEQITFLHERGIEIPQEPGTYQFYYERIGGEQL